MSVFVGRVEALAQLSAAYDAQVSDPGRTVPPRPGLVLVSRDASRDLLPTAAERAGKAVTARIRDAIRHIGYALPELAAHLDRTIRTGTTCRYEPDRIQSRGQGRR